MALRVLVRGGGDLASGVALRLHRAGWQVLITELAHPLAVRRYVSYAQAVYDGEIQIEETHALRVANLVEAENAIHAGKIAVMVDPEAAILAQFAPHVLIDGRMRKKSPERNFLNDIAFLIGIGPGFTAGMDSHAVIETNRGPFLGRVIWKGPAQEDTGIPERIGEFRIERVLRSPAKGVIETVVDIGARVKKGDVVARVGGRQVTAPFDGVIRGLLMAGMEVGPGEKIGDVDPRGDPRLCWLVSDKALSVGGGVLEAILSWQPVRSHLY